MFQLLGCSVCLLPRDETAAARAQAEAPALAKLAQARQARLLGKALPPPSDHRAHPQHPDAGEGGRRWQNPQPRSATASERRARARMEGGDRRALSARAATGARPHDGDAAPYSARAKAGERHRAVAAVASSAKLAAESSRPSSDEPWSREHRDRDELLADENGAVGQRWNLRVGESEMGRVALSSVSPFAVRSGNQFVTSRARFELAMPDPPHQPRDQPQPPCVLPPIGQSLQWAAAAEKLTAQLTAEFLGLERGDESVSAAAICGQGLAPPQYAPAPPGSSASSASQASALGAPVNRSLT